MKKLIIQILGLGASVLIPVILLNWWMDPYQFVRADDSYFPENQRYLNPGLVLNREYDAVLAGTSHSQNFVPKEMDSLLGTHILKLAIAGSTVHEQSLSVKLALQMNPKLQTVYWGIDASRLANEPEAFTDGVSFPKYLYNNDMMDDWMYFLNPEITRESLTKIFTKKPKGDLQTLNNWSLGKKFNRDLVLNIYADKRKLKQMEARFGQKIKKADSQEVLMNVNANIRELAEAYPNVQFILFFTPRTVLFYKEYEENGTLASYLETRKTLVLKLAGLKNVRLHDFEPITEISANLDLFLDLTHYSPKVNQILLANMAEGNLLVNLENIDLNNKKLVENMDAFKL